MYCCTLKPRPHASKGWKQYTPSMAVLSIPMPPSLLQKLKNLQRSACEKHPSTFDRLVRTEILQIKKFSLPVSKICLCVVSLFSFGVADKEEALTARAKTLSQRAVRGVLQHLAFGEEQTTRAPVAERISLVLLRRGFCRLASRPRTKLSRLRFGPVSTSPSQNRRRPSSSYTGHKVVPIVFDPENPGRARSF